MWLALFSQIITNFSQKISTRLLTVLTTCVIVRIEQRNDISSERGNGYEYQ